MIQIDYSTKDFKNLICKRIVNDESKNKTILTKIESNPVSPKIEIEDSLNGKLFFETLKEQYSGQFLKRDAMPSASNAYAIQQRSENSDCNLNPK